MGRAEVDWSIQPLGEMTDAEIARQLGVSRERVRQIRARAGIPKYVEPPAQWEAQLGTRSDPDIAADYGVPVSLVSSRRKTHGILGYFPSSRWDDEPLLGRVPDRVLAEKHGVHLVSIATARWNRGIPAWRGASIDWDAETRLGKVYDEVLAKEYGVTSRSVGSARKWRGIPPLPRPPSRWDSEPLLGKVMDVELAQKHGVRPSSVSAARRRRGIPRYHQ